MNPWPGPSITCPICGRTSWHPEDVKQGWCNACGWSTSVPGGGAPAEVPIGFEWRVFRGGELDGCGRLLQSDRLPDRYEHMPSGDVYERELGQDEYVLVEP